MPGGRSLTVDARTSISLYKSMRSVRFRAVPRSKGLPLPDRGGPRRPFGTALVATHPSGRGGPGRVVISDAPAGEPSRNRAGRRVMGDVLGRRRQVDAPVW